MNTNLESLPEVLFAATHSFRHEMKKSLNAKEIGLNGMHVRCLSYITKMESCTANQLSLSLGRDKAQIARLVKDMIEKGWLTKQPDPQDKRSQLLLLTETGKALSREIKQNHQQIQQRMLKNLSDSQKSKLLSMLDQMIRNLNDG